MKKKPIIIVLLIVLALVLVLGAAFLFFAMNDDNSSKDTNVNSNTSINETTSSTEFQEGTGHSGDSNEASSSSSSEYGRYENDNGNNVPSDNSSSTSSNISTTNLLEGLAVNDENYLTIIPAMFSAPMGNTGRMQANQLILSMSAQDIPTAYQTLDNYLYFIKTDPADANISMSWIEAVNPTPPSIVSSSATDTLCKVEYDEITHANPNIPGSSDAILHKTAYIRYDANGKIIEITVKA